MHENRWAKRCTEWQPREGRRNRGRPARRWRDDIEVTAGKTWMRKTERSSDAYRGGGGGGGGMFCSGLTTPTCNK